MANKKQNLKMAKKDVLHDSEEIIHCIHGQYKTQSLGNEVFKNGILMATNERLLFYAVRFTGHDSEVLKYDKLSSLETGSKLTGNYLRLFTSGNEFEMIRIVDKEFEPIVQYIQDRIDSKEIRSSTQSDSTEDNLDRLKKLKELLDMDAITQEEYEAKKKELLNI